MRWPKGRSRRDESGPDSLEDGKVPERAEEKSVTDRLEDILSASDRKFPFLVENALDVISLLDGDGKVRYISPAIERFLGYSPSELVGTNALGIIHPDDREMVLDTFSRLMKHPGVTERVQYRIKHKNGGWRWAESVGNNLIQHPDISCLVINTRDISDRKHAEDALRESEEYYRALIENSMDAIVIIDGEARYKYSNPALERVLGYSPEDLIGRSSLELIHPEDVATAAEVIARAVKNSAYSPTVEVRIRHADGTYLYFEGVGRSYLDNPAVAGIVVALRDITGRKRAEEELRKYREDLEEMVDARTRELVEMNRRLLSEVDRRRRMEEELRAANRELEAFAYTLSHDLRSPLALAGSFAREALFALEGDDRELQRNCLDNIVEALERTDDYIFSLYQYARAGLPHGRAARIDLEEAVREAFSYLEEDLRDRVVEFKVGENLPDVYVDPVRLRQVLSNLLENAVKYMGDEPQPEVEIGAAEEGGMVTVFVRDNGMGIPRAKRETVFEPFMRLKESGSGGLGIGLSTAKRAVEAWGGRIWVESPEEGGSVFYFTAPAPRQP